MPKQHPAQTAAGLVRRWEDCLAPHDLPKWAEDAALAMRALLAQPAPSTEEDAGNAGVAIDFHQATRLLEMYGGAQSEITLTKCDGHSGRGLYAHFTEYPEDGSWFLGVTDQHAPAAPGAAAAAPSQATQDVLAERRRQVDVEGWTPEHDDEHGAGSMAFAAAAYAVHAQAGPQLSTPLWNWTGWCRDWWKPKSKRQDLVRATALLLAEIERMDRAAQAQGGA